MGSRAAWPSYCYIYAGRAWFNEDFSSKVACGFFKSECLCSKAEYKNLGKDCWTGCKYKQGRCNWCGTSGMCCRIGWTGNGCDGTMGNKLYHMCVERTEYMNLGKDCWYACGKKEGRCNWCGTPGLCCRIGWTGNVAMEQWAIYLIMCASRRK